jgi:histidinol phosphatase-like PHP family hydrolase
MRSYGVGFEVNSSGYRHGVGDCYPNLGFVRAAREADVETVIVGSDSHRVEALGGWLNHALETLRRAGFISTPMMGEGGDA